MRSKNSRRKKLYGCNPHVRIDFVACDATNLPIRENCMDMAVSYYGLANMSNLLPSGLSEANRILKHGSRLISSYVQVKEDSQGFQIARDVMQKNQMEGGEAYFLSPSLRELHAQIFARISATRVVEAVSPGTEADLLPYKDEWFAFDVLDCQKAKKE